MRTSTRGDYAARALLSLALHGTDRPTSVKEIAERTHLPQPYLEQILLSVKGAGLVRSKRGVGGGYVLARPPHAITLADIVSAVEGPQIVLAEHPDHCEGHCILQEVWVGVDDESRRILATSVTGYATSYQFFDISSAALAQLMPGATVEFAVHCHQTVGGQYIDVGLARWKQ